MPKVSVLMPVYNAQKYLAEAIDSIIAQTYSDWELIIINDGSTDDSENIILSYKDSRIKYSKNTQNRGLIYTRNKMIELASGEYLAFLDSDDIAYPERLKHQIDFLDKNPDYGLCGTWSEMINEQGSKIKKLQLSDQNDEIQCTLLFSSTFVQSSIMIRKQLLIEHPYDEKYPLAEDFDLWCRLSRVCKLSNIPICLTKYRWHSSNISKSKKERLDELVKNIYKKELQIIGLDANDNELNIHSAIRDRSILPIPNNQFFPQLKTWLQKLSTSALSSNHYDRDTLMATICFRWIFACKERGAYLKILQLPIDLNNKGVIKLGKMLAKRF
ncbi:MAG: glycosyltransferase family 2 protein [Dysgonomonas sp.]